MSNNGSDPVFASAGRFDFTVRADDDHVSISGRRRPRLDLAAGQPR